MSSAFDSTGGVSQSALVTGLTNGGSYTYFVRCADAQNNEDADDFPLTISVASSADAVPGFVQQVLVQSNENFERGNDFVSALPNPVLAGNTLIAAITYGYRAGRTVTITDNAGSNSWKLIAGPYTDPSQTFSSAIYASFNSAAGTQNVRVSFDAALDDFQAVISEWYNVSGAVDGVALATGSNAPNVTAGTITTTQNNDLVYQYAIDSSWGVGMEGNSFTSYTAGAGFHLLTADHRIAVVSQYAIPSAAGPIAATFKTGGGTVGFNTVAIALRAAATGTAPNPTAMRVVSTYHTRVNSGTNTLNFPTVGNLLVATTAYNETQETLGAITDSKGNSWTNVIGSGDPQMAYAKNAVSGSDLVLTMKVTEHGSGNLQLLIYDVVNADNQPMRAGALCARTAASSTVSVPGAPTLTPLFTNSVVLASIGFYTGPPSAPRRAAWRLTGSIEREGWRSLEGRVPRASASRPWRAARPDLRPDT